MIVLLVRVVMTVPRGVTVLLVTTVRPALIAMIVLLVRVVMTVLRGVTVPHVRVVMTVLRGVTVLLVTTVRRALIAMIVLLVRVVMTALRGVIVPSAKAVTIAPHETPRTSARHVPIAPHGTVLVTARSPMGRKIVMTPAILVTLSAVAGQGHHSLAAITPRNSLEAHARRSSTTRWKQSPSPRTPQRA
jgi:hypothetical protein